MGDTDSTTHRFADRPYTTVASLTSDSEARNPGHRLRRTGPSRVNLPRTTSAWITAGRTPASLSAHKLTHLLRGGWFPAWLP